MSPTCGEAEGVIAWRKWTSDEFSGPGVKIVEITKSSNFSRYGWWVECARNSEKKADLVCALLVIQN